MDGTLTNAHVWGGILEYFKVHNLRRWTHRAYMTYHYPLYIFRKIGIISEGTFRKPWPAHLGWYLRGYTISEAEQVWHWVLETQVRQSWRADTCQLLSQHNENGYLTFLVSGTPMPLLKLIGEEIGADYAIGTELAIKNGRYTGWSSGPACIDEEKVTLTQDYLARLGIEINFDASYAYADSSSDRYLLEMVGHPVATYPDERLRQIALEIGWQRYPP